MSFHDRDWLTSVGYVSRTQDRTPPVGCQAVVAWRTENLVPGLVTCLRPISSNRNILFVVKEDLGHKNTFTLLDPDGRLHRADCVMIYSGWLYLRTAEIGITHDGRLV